VVAGLAADLDSLTSLAGPAAYLAWHRGAAHSLLAALLIPPLAALATFAAFQAFDRAGRAETTSASAPRNLKAMLSLTLPAGLAAALLHLLLDLCQVQGASLLWPFSSRRFALDLVPKIDPWLLAVLIGAIVLPELFRLVSDEIGARQRRPRGRRGAVAGLSFALLYLGLRALLHANTVTSLEAHTIAGESARRVGAFPDSTSPFLWHSIVETQSALNLVLMRSMGGEVGYASAVTTLHKPEPSPMLLAAQDSTAAVAFLRFARFPKATVESERDGYSVEIQDLTDQATGEKSSAILAGIDLDKNSRVVSSDLQWQTDRGSPR